ncbi:hemin-degrading factor [soil metagenome]
MTTNTTRERFLTTRREGKMHGLEIARAVGATEVELIQAVVEPDADIAAVRLEGPPMEILGRLRELGTVKAITRSPSAVIECIGEYGAIEMFGTTGQSVATIDLRIFSQRWHSAYAVREQTKRGESKCLQFFDAQGTAIHKTYLKPASNVEAYAAIVDTFRAKTQDVALELAAPVAMTPPKPDDAIDVSGLRTAWTAMKDTHEFYGILRRFSVARTQALRLAGPELATPVPASALRATLERSRDAKLPIMVFVGNSALVQIYSGPVDRITEMGTWVNVLDPAFDLHIDASAITESWIVRKPTVDGVVTALEIYDARGEQLALLCGKRKPGQKEDPTWRDIVEAFAMGRADRQDVSI